MIQTSWINPAFHRHPLEATLIGRILAAFGEIGLEICRTCARGIGSEIPTLRALYRLRMTSARIDIAHNLAMPKFKEQQLSGEWAETYTMAMRCLQIRNQFSHCQWGDHPNAGLFFTDLSEAARETDNLDLSWRHIDAPLLAEQEMFFACTIELVRFLDHELSVRQGRLQSHVWPKPLIPSQPLLHNPPEKHVPPWLEEDQKALHLARALAAQGGDPTPTPAQQALDRAREEKREQRRSQREAAQQGSSKKQLD